MTKRKKTDEDQENQSNASDADNFGLPDIEYKPLERTEGSETGQEQSASATESEQSAAATESNTEQQQYHYVPPVEEKSKAPVIISIVIGLVLILSGFFIYYYVYKPKAEKERKEQIAREQQARKKAEADRIAREKEEAERKRREAEEAAANAKPAEGTIETLSAKTGRYYVVVTSAIDGDLIMDFAKKQSVKGVSSKIIPPFGKWKFHRLAISDYDTFALAQTSADAAKADYGSGVWVMRY